MGSRNKDRIVGLLTKDRYRVARASARDQIVRLLSSLQPRRTAAPLIRLGPDSDGGYVVPDDLDGIVGCLSPGVAGEVRFDQTVADRGIDVFMADASVDGPPISHARFHFTKHFIGTVDDDTFLRLDTFAGRFAPPEGDLMMQMDIEGAEWAILLDASSALLSRLRLMIVEFHDMELVFSEFPFRIMSAVFQKLLATHSVVHIHPNNVARPVTVGGISVPPLTEITFLRNDRAFAPGHADTFPHPLDVDCAGHKPPVVQPRWW